MKIILLNIIRRLFKSFTKRESLIQDAITLEKFKKKFKHKTSENISLESSRINYKKIKIIVTITFLYNKKKIKNLERIIKNLKLISKNIKIFIITNDVRTNKIQKILKQKSIELKIITINKLLHTRLLPWHHIEIMKKEFKNKSNTHFINLEDDILFQKKNFLYWLTSREILKKYNAIPGFVRTEINKTNKKIYLVDFIDKINLNKLPIIKINNKQIFVNHKFPYQGMYIYDRNLMREYLSSEAINPDCGYGGVNINYINKDMINLSLLEKSNIGLTYMNIPEGFNNRMLTLFDRSKNTFDNNCLIHHLSNKYVGQKNSIFSKIQLKTVLK